MKGRSDLPGCGDGRHKITWIKRWSGRNELEVSESGSDASAFNGPALCIRSSKRTDTGRTTHWHHAGVSLVCVLFPRSCFCWSALWGWLGHTDLWRSCRFSLLMANDMTDSVPLQRLTCDMLKWLCCWKEYTCSVLVSCCSFCFHV